MDLYPLKPFKVAANAYLLYGSKQKSQQQDESQIRPRTNKESKQPLQYEMISILNEVSQGILSYFRFWCGTKLP